MWRKVYQVLSVRVSSDTIGREKIIMSFPESVLTENTKISNPTIPPLVNYFKKNNTADMQRFTEKGVTASFFKILGHSHYSCTLIRE